MLKQKKKKSFQQAMKKVDTLIKDAATITLSGNPDTLETEIKMHEAAKKVKKEGITNERD